MRSPMIAIARINRPRGARGARRPVRTSDKSTNTAGPRGKPYL